MACRTGCPTQDCESYAACCRTISVAKVSIAAAAHGPQTARQWQADIDHFRAARRQGINPAGSSRAHVDAALEASDRTGTAFKAA